MDTLPAAIVAIMAHIQIDDISPTVTYTVGGSARDEFPIPFAYFATSDIVVTVDGTELTLNTDYTIDGTAVDSGFSSGTVTLDVAVTDAEVVVERILTIERTTDFPNSGPFITAALNTQFDKITAWCQQLNAAILAVGQRVTDWIALVSTAITGDIVTVNFATRSATELATVSDLTLYVRTAGSYEIGDGGGALYKRVDALPSHPAYIETADGSWFELVSQRGVDLRSLRISTDPDDTNAFNRAIEFIVYRGGGVIHVPTGTTWVGDTIDIPTEHNIPIAVVGEAGVNSMIRRMPTFNGTIFKFQGSVASGSAIEFKNLHFVSVHTDDLAGTAPTIHLLDPIVHGVIIRDCIFWDQYTSILIDGTHNVTIDNVQVLGTGTALLAGWTQRSGIEITGHVAGIFISNCNILGQATNDDLNLIYGILITGGDGIQCVNTGIGAREGVRIEGGHSLNIDDVFFSNCVMDSCNVGGVTITGTNAQVYANIRFDGCHINANTNTDPLGIKSVCVGIDGDCDYVQFSGCNIGGAAHYGIYVNGTNNWAGNPKKAISFINCDVSECNGANDAAVPGIFINSPNVTIIGGSSGNNVSGLGHQSFGLQIGSAAGGLLVDGLRFYGNIDAQLDVDAAVGRITIRDCPGVSDTLTAITPATTIDLVASSGIFDLTGTTTIATIDGGWEGREVQIIAETTLNFTNSDNVFFSGSKPAGSLLTARKLGDWWWLG